MRGYIQARQTSGGGFNEHGEPIPAEVTWGDKVECMYYANTLNNHGKYEDGRFIQSSYVITLDDMNFTANYVRLLDSREREICEKEVQGYAEVLEDVQRVKLTI